MKKKFSLRSQLIIILLIFIVGILGLVYIFQTTFLDDFYKTNKIKTIENVGKNVASSIGDDDLEDFVDQVSMSNEVCVRVVSNSDEYNYVGACTLRGLDNMTINMIANEVIETDNQEKLFDDFHYQRRMDERPEDVYIFAKLIQYNNENIMVLVSSGITPLDATINTLKSQYMIIVGIVFVMTLILPQPLPRVF